MSVAPCQVALWRRQGVGCPVGLYTLPFVPPSVSRRIPGLSGSGCKSTWLSICARPGAGWGHPHKSETWESCFRPGVLGPGLLLPRAPASRIQKSSPSIWWVGLSGHGACWPGGLLYIKAPHFIHTAACVPTRHIPSPLGAGTQRGSAGFSGTSVEKGRRGGNHVKVKGCSLCKHQPSPGSFLWV